jgi:hypothetical protein
LPLSCAKAANIEVGRATLLTILPETITVISSYEETIRRVQNVTFVAKQLRDDARAKVEQAIIDREVVITKRDAAWRHLAARVATRLPQRQ